MKRILIIALVLLCLNGCKQIGKQDVDPDQRYFDLINAIKERDNFVNSSNYYDISVEMSSIDNGYRFYVIIDNPHAAIYDVEAIAIENDVDYSKTMAANVGIFEDTVYSMIPNQKNPEKGFVPGIVFSGITQNPETTLYVYVSFKNEDYSIVHSEYFKLDVRYGEY